MKQAFIIGGIAMVIIGTGILLFIQDAKISKYEVTGSPKDAPAVGQEFPNQGQAHINSGQAHDSYNSNPPTSGPHLAQPANWGAYSAPLQDEQAVHNLEHGGIWITYKDINDQTKAQLETIAKANGGSVIMSPRDSNDSKIVLASWTRMEKLDSYDEGKILEFIKANKNKSPEPIAQ